MYPSKHARELAILLRISRELDIVGDVSATVDNPSELLAWATILDQPTIAGWRAEDSGHRYLQVTADHRRAPLRGRVAAVLSCERHREFWDALGLHQCQPGQTQVLALRDLSRAWAAMPITPADVDIQPPSPPSTDTEAQQTRHSAGQRRHKTSRRGNIRRRNGDVSAGEAH